MTYKNFTKIIIVVFLVLATTYIVIMIKDSNNSNSLINHKDDYLNSNTSKPDVIYSIINFEEGSLTKCIIDVRLTDRISEGAIDSIARYLENNEGDGCSPLFIFYFLPGETPGVDAAWALSHFNPYLEVQINKMDLETEATLEAIIPEVNENIVGIWIDDGMIPHIIVFELIDGIYFMTTEFSDGSGETKTLSVEIVNGEERFHDDAGMDYIVIKPNGKLAFYDNLGLIFELESKQ